MTTTDYGVPSRRAWAFRCIELLKHEGPHLIIRAHRGRGHTAGRGPALAPERTVIDYHDDEHHPYSPLTPNRGLVSTGLAGAPQRWRDRRHHRLGSGDDRSIRTEPRDAAVNLASARRRRELKRDDLLAHLERAGYHRTPLVEDRGDGLPYLARSWTSGRLAAPPVRTDFFGDTIETIRSFDPLTQRQGEALEFLVIPPASLRRRSQIAAAQRPRLLELSDELELPSAPFVTAWQRLEAGVRYPGIEGA